MACLENETEVSFFDRQDYEAFKLDPAVRRQSFIHHTTFTYDRTDKMGCVTCCESCII